MKTNSSRTELHRREGQSEAAIAENARQWAAYGRILRLPSVRQLTCLSTSTLYAMMARGDFPRPVRLGKRAVGWRESDLQDWLESREQAAS